MRNAIALLTLVLATSPAAAQVTKPAVISTPASTSNYTSNPSGTYPRATLTYIVIHKTEGTQASAAAWFANPAAAACAHYIVGHNGSIDQCVADRDVAWHAGNWTYNTKSIGIEHEGMTAQDDVTDAQYAASARLAAFLAVTYQVPIDRTHFIGHSEVPDPNNPSLGGGAGHHTDPGTHWDWARYMALVRLYASAIVLGPTGAAGSQPLPYVEDFDGSTTLFSSNVSDLFFVDDPASFAASNARLPAAATSGLRCAGTAFSAPYGAGDYGALISPPLDLSGAARPRLTCKVWYDLFSGMDGAFVAGTRDGQTWISLAPVAGYTGQPSALGGAGWTGASGGWIDCEVDLSALAGSGVAQVALAMQSDAASAGGGGLYVDDVRVDDAGTGGGSGGATSSGSTGSTSARTGGGGGGGCSFGAESRPAALAPYALLLLALLFARRTNHRATEITEDHRD